MSAARDRSGIGANSGLRSDLLAFLILALLGVALRWPTVHVGLMSDDFMHHGMLTGTYPGEGYAPFDLYSFFRRGEVLIAHVEQGTAPWWAVPELHGTVLRPLASLLLWLDFTALPGRVMAWHLHTMLWFAASTICLGLVARELLPRPVALLAVLLYVCEAGTVSPLAWLANRCVLISASFGFLALWVHIRWRTRDGQTPALIARRGPWLVAGLMSACILAGEYGLGILAYLLAWELVLGPGDWRVRVQALLPAVIPVALYLVAHKLLGYGTFGAEVYADPFHTPRGYAKWASKRLPKLAHAGFWSVPGATIHVFRFSLSSRIDHLWLPDAPSPDDYRAAHLAMAWSGVALAALALALARSAWTPRERQTLRALGLGAFLGLLPIAIAPSHSRLLIIAQLGFCTIVAAVIVGCARLLLLPRTELPERDPPRSRKASLARGLLLLPLAGLLAWLHTIGDLRWGQTYIQHLDDLQAANVAAFTEGDILDQPLDGRDVIMLNGPSQSVGLYGEYVLATQGWPAPRTWRPLALGSDFPMHAARPRANTLELSAIQGAWIQTAGELFFRREDQPLRAGDVLEYPSLRVEILADTEGHPTRIRFRFDRPLDDPSLLFVIATPRGLMSWDVPPVGGRNMVPLPRLPPVEDGELVRLAPR